MVTDWLDPKFTEPVTVGVCVEYAVPDDIPDALADDAATDVVFGLDDDVIVDDVIGDDEAVAVGSVVGTVVVDGTGWLDDFVVVVTADV